MDSNHKTIYLVDDNMTNLMVGKNALAKYYNIITLNSGKLLLKMLEKNIPDLILLDVDMPEMSGYDVIKIIKSKKETKHIPIIFLTAKNEDENELEGFSLGAIDYITKPFSPIRLLKRIEVHLIMEAQKKSLVAFNNNLKEIVETKTKSVFELQNTILRTMADLVECRDDITGGHIERTTHYLSLLLNAMSDCDLYREKIASWNLNLLLQSAQLHDVGKIVIKDDILLKPGKLTPEEFEEIKKHASFGEKIIEKIEKNTTDQSFLEYARVFALTHHEKWDGSGYPKGLKNEEIPLEGRLMAIADVYDALVSDRPYKTAFTHENAVDIIMSSKGTHFDPNLADIFFSISDKFKNVKVKPDV